MTVGRVPPAVPSGGRIAVVAPAGPMLAERVQSGLAPLREAGFDVVTRPDIARGRGTYLAGSDDTRAGELVDALLDPTVHAIVCIRGGYGAMRILRRLDAALEGHTLQPKRLAGFSDITALHTWALHKQNWCSIHSAMPFNFASAREPSVAVSAAGLIQALTTPSPTSGVASCPLIGATGGKVTGPLVGGNLSLVEALYRSPWLPTLTGAILFVEDVGESRYRLDRLITSLELRGAATEVAGVAIGGFTGCGSSPDGDAAFVAEQFGAWGVPVAMGVDAGHRQPNRPLWLGLQHTLDADNGTLRREPT